MSIQTTTVNQDRIQFGEGFEKKSAGYKYLNASEERIEDAQIVVFTDGDADGIASAAVVDYVFDSMDVEIIPIGPHKPAIRYESKAFKTLNEYGREGMTVFVLDTSLGDTQTFNHIKKPLKEASEKFNLHIFDHHKWNNDEAVDYIREHSNTLEIDTRQDREWEHNGYTISDRSAAKMVYDYFVDNGVDFPEVISDRVKAVSVGDTWIRTDEDTFVHTDAQMMLNSVEYITGRIPLEDRFTSEWWGYGEWAQEFISEDSLGSESVITAYGDAYNEIIEKELSFLKENDEFFSRETINGKDVAFIYGDISANDIAEHLRSEGVELTVVFYPSGSCSLRGSDSFTECDIVAESFEGGGHEQAAGARVYSQFDEFSQDTHQSTHGERSINEMRSFLEDFI